jgi:hypothetical protein
MECHNAAFQAVAFQAFGDIIRYVIRYVIRYIIRYVTSHLDATPFHN